MFIPAARQHVRVRNSEGEFLVLAVDREAAIAYLALVAEIAETKEAAFVDLSPVPVRTPESSTAKMCRQV